MPRLPRRLLGLVVTSRLSVARRTLPYTMMRRHLAAEHSLSLTRNLSECYSPDNTAHSMILVVLYNGIFQKYTHSSSSIDYMTLAVYSLSPLPTPHSHCYKTLFSRKPIFPPSRFAVVYTTLEARKLSAMLSLFLPRQPCGSPLSG